MRRHSLAPIGQARLCGCLTAPHRHRLVSSFSAPVLTSASGLARRGVGSAPFRELPWQHPTSPGAMSLRGEATPQAGQVSGYRAAGRGLYPATTPGPTDQSRKPRLFRSPDTAGGWHPNNVCRPVILAHWEAETGGLQVGGYLVRPYLKNNSLKKLPLGFISSTAKTKNKL